MSTTSKALRGFILGAVVPFIIIYGIAFFVAFIIEIMSIVGWIWGLAPFEWIFADSRWWELMRFFGAVATILAIPFSIGAAIDEVKRK